MAQWGVLGEQSKDNVNGHTPLFGPYGDTPSVSRADTHTRTRSHADADVESSYIDDSGNGGDDEKDGYDDYEQDRGGIGSDDKVTQILGEEEEEGERNGCSDSGSDCCEIENKSGGGTGTGYRIVAANSGFDKHGSHRNHGNHGNHGNERSHHPNHSIHHESGQDQDQDKDNCIVERGLFAVGNQKQSTVHPL